MTPSLSRRTFLSIAGGTALAVSLAGTTAGAIATPASAADEFDTLIARWRELYLGTGFDAATEPYKTKLATLGTTAAGFRDTMAPAGGSLWPTMGYADAEPDLDAESYGFSAQMNNSYSRLRTMAEAYRQPGTGLTGDTGLRDAVLTGLDHLYADVYNEHTTRYGNWWNWQIGGAQTLMDTCVLMHEHLSADQIAGYCRAVDHFIPDSMLTEYTGTSTGANRVDIVRSVILRGIVGKDPARVTLARDALSPVFPYVTSGDGFYHDGSFIQHRNVPYVGGYGWALVDGLARLFALLGGSTWAITDPGRSVIFDAVEDTIAPFIYNGLLHDSVNGRGISRQGTGQNGGQGYCAPILMLGLGASAAQRDRWNGLVKGWLRRDTYQGLAGNPAMGIAARARLEALMADTSVKPIAEPVEHRLFPMMARATHRRPGWCASLSMSSAAIAYYEFGNGENKRAYHTGSGMLYWWGRDHGLGNYSDAFWPTVDPYRLPGITASKKVLADGEGGNWGQPAPAATWAGGTTDGEFAAVGQDTRGLSSTLQAKKSWFFLDDAVVCLGAAVQCTDGTGVDSVIDNRNLGATGTETLTVNGVRQASTPGWSATIERARWAHLDGHAGYLFPGGATISALREERTGSWKDINDGQSATPITRRYATLWFDHGTDPTAGSYAYVLLPGASAARTARRAADRDWLEIIANTGAQQGVHVPGLGLTAVNFWEPGTVGELTATGTASVLIRHTRRTATLYLAEPTRALAGLDLIWDRPVRGVIAKDDSVTVLGAGRSLRLRVDATGKAGATQKITVRLG